MYGQPPYMALNPMEIFTKVLHNKLLFPRVFDEGAKSLIKHLTCHDLTRRYGHVKDSENKIKNHRFFHGTDWSTLREMKMKEHEIPYIPSQHNLEDEESEQPMIYENLPEIRDDEKYPPIKKDKDPFSDWFWNLIEKK